MSGGWQEDGVIHLFWPESLWKEEHRDHIQNTMRSLEGHADHKITVTYVPHIDWNAKWAKSVDPIRVGHRIVIRPSWMQVDVTPDSIEIILDPQQAFGTGHHATTQLLIEWLESAIKGGERLLDIGTGSGILAMVALRLGASMAVGIDHDPVALDCARSYALLNGFGSELEFRVESIENSSLQSPDQFDMIVANIDGNTFRGCAHLIPSMLKDGGRLYISGILVEDEQEMAALFSEDGCVLLEVRKRDGGVAMGFQFRGFRKK